MLPVLRRRLTALTAVFAVFAFTRGVQSQDTLRGIGAGARADTGLGKARYHALLIGVTRYDDTGWGKLENPVKDAQKLRDILVTRYRFAADDVTLLQNPRKTAILDELQRLQALGPNDNLLIFFAGHGEYDEGQDQGFWMPTDARRQRRSSQLSNAELVQSIRAINSRHTLIIADVCFGGALRGGDATSGVTTGLERLYALPTRRIMTSGTKREPVPDKSVFLRAVLNHLGRNNEAFLTAQQLFAAIQVPVANNSSVTPQYKPIQGVGDDGGEFLFPLQSGGRSTEGNLYVPDPPQRARQRGGEINTPPTEPRDIVIALSHEFVDLVKTKEMNALGALTYLPKSGGNETWKENFLALVKNDLTNAILSARPDPLDLDGQRAFRTEVTITMTYRDQVVRGPQQRTIRFTLFHNLIGSTWSLTKLQILDKPPG